MQHKNIEYPFGFYTRIASEKIKKGINEHTVSLISKKKKEPKWMLDWRLESLYLWKKMKEPKWANLKYNKIKYQDIIYYSSIKETNNTDTELKDTFKRLGVPLNDQKKLSGVAIDFIMDSSSIKNTLNKTLKKNGIIFCPISEAINKYPELVKKYIGTVVPKNDNFYAALNSAVFSDGSFCYIPKNIKCPVELSTYFRINEPQIGQFERTLIIADSNSYISYLEGCTAPERKDNQLHAAVVELIALSGSEIKYSTIQNWYPGDKAGNGGILNFVTKRGLCKSNSKISWTQVETGSSVTWKYPSCILEGKNAKGEFYSIALTKNLQQADTGTKMIHIGENTKSVIISKGISSNQSINTYRGLVNIEKNAKNSHNFSQCDSLLRGNECQANTFPRIIIKNSKCKVEHEATTSKIGEEQMFYCNQRGISKDKAIGLIVNGFSREVLNKLPMEFTLEAKKLLEISLEGSVG